MEKNQFALTPPMGWNSWDCYGASVTEKELLQNADYMTENLKEFGWEYIVCDIQWYEPLADSSHLRIFAWTDMEELFRRQTVFHLPQKAVLRKSQTIFIIKD